MVGKGIIMVECQFCGNMCEVSEGYCNFCLATFEVIEDNRGYKLVIWKDKEAYVCTTLE